ncbi:MAG: ribonuclease [Dehalococcoidia bacterium]|nr:ribonuclease [Dehalococcoidia bacterium]
MGGSDGLVDLKTLQNSIRVTFRDPYWANLAFVHRSYLHENPGDTISSNERLEFLGDAFIGYTIGLHLFKEFPDLAEGELTRFRAALVKGDTLFRVAEKLGLGQHLYLGRGEDKSGGRQKAGNLARAFEALVGAILLDRGAKIAEGFVLRSLSPYLDELRNPADAVDDKSQLQELSQALGLGAPKYRVVEERGPDHAKEFTVEAVVGEAVGASKQAAEKEAARIAIDQLRSR